MESIEFILFIIAAPIIFFLFEWCSPFMFTLRKWIYTVGTIKMRSNSEPRGVHAGRVQNQQNSLGPSWECSVRQVVHLGGVFTNRSFTVYLYHVVLVLYGNQFLFNTTPTNLYRTLEKRQFYWKFNHIMFLIIS